MLNFTARRISRTAAKDWCQSNYPHGIVAQWSIPQYLLSGLASTEFRTMSEFRDYWIQVRRSREGDIEAPDAR